MFKIVLVVASIISITSGFVLGQAPKIRTKRVINGFTANIKYHNYYVYVITGDSYCGGSLIKQDLVLTAAHCLQNVNVANIKVLVNLSYRFDPSAQSYNARWYQVHPWYSRVPYYDVGVIKLANNASRWNVIQIGEKSPENGYWVRIVGYGSIRCDPAYTENRQIYCSSTYSKDFKTTVTQIQSYSSHVMITYNPGTSACYGDSGSSVVEEDGLVGVVSAVDDLCVGTNSFVTVTKDSEIYKFFIKYYM